MPEDISRRVGFDVDTEQNFSRFLRRHLYRRLRSDFFAVEDVAMQKKGIDFLLWAKSRIWYGDEKVCAHYLNTKKTNFILELSLYGGRTGWFLDDALCTDIYAFIWGRLDGAKFPFRDDRSSNAYYKSMAYEDITGAVVQFFMKSSLQNALDTYGLTVPVLRDVAGRINRMERREGVFMYKPRNLGLPDAPGIVGFCINTKYSERPVMLVASQKFLRNCAFKMYCVTKERVTPLVCGPGWKPEIRSA